MTRINGETKARVARPDRLAAGYRISVVVLHHQHHYHRHQHRHHDPCCRHQHCHDQRHQGVGERTPCISVTAPDDNEEEGKRREEEVSIRIVRIMIIIIKINCDDDLKSTLHRFHGTVVDCRWTAATQVHSALFFHLCLLIIWMSLYSRIAILVAVIIIFFISMSSSFLSYLIGDIS